MNDREPLTIAVLAERIRWNAERIRNLDLLHKSHELELHDLRVEVEARLRQSYLTGAEMRNVFVTRDELEKRAGVRREWPLIAFTGVVAISNLVTMIVVLGGTH